MRCAAGTSDWWSRMRSRRSVHQLRDVSLRSNPVRVRDEIRCQPQGSDLESSQRNSNDRSLKFHSSHTFTHLIRRSSLRPHVTLSPAQSTAAKRKDSLCLSITHTPRTRVTSTRKDLRRSIVEERLGSEAYVTGRSGTPIITMFTESREWRTQSQNRRQSLCV